MIFTRLLILRLLQGLYQVCVGCYKKGFVMGLCRAKGLGFRVQGFLHRSYMTLKILSVEGFCFVLERASFLQMLSK